MRSRFYILACASLLIGSCSSSKPVADAAGPGPDQAAAQERKAAGPVSGGKEHTTPMPGSLQRKGVSNGQEAGQLEKSVIRKDR